MKKIHLRRPVAGYVEYEFDAPDDSPDAATIAAQLNNKTLNRSDGGNKGWLILSARNPDPDSPTATQQGRSHTALESPGDWEAFEPSSGS